MYHKNHQTSVLPSCRGTQSCPKADLGLQVPLPGPQGPGPATLGRAEAADRAGKETGCSRSVCGVDTPSEPVRGSDPDQIPQQVGVGGVHTTCDPLRGEWDSSCTDGLRTGYLQEH